MQQGTSLLGGNRETAQFLFGSSCILALLAPKLLAQETRSGEQGSGEHAQVQLTFTESQGEKKLAICRNTFYVQPRWRTAFSIYQGLDGQRNSRLRRKDAGMQYKLDIGPNIDQRVRYRRREVRVISALERAVG